MSTKRLSVVIDADTSKFDKSIKGMQGTMDKATGGIGGAFKKVGGAFTGLLGSIGKIAGATGVFKLVDGALNMVKNSVDSAINRFDVLQNSERVFQNMGFEASEASVMMDNLVDSITGLPTPMESAVQGVQRLASSTGDPEGSEKIYSALNNSVLGFGGSNEEVDRTVQMLSRSLQKGKVQGDEFNTMMDTMGPVMNAVADEMGYTISELQSGLSDGSIDIDNFTDTLLRMNEEGGGGLVSLEQIARDSTGGIGTSLENVQNAFNRGMANIIESINEVLESKGLPNISEMIQIFGQKAEEVFSKVSESIPTMVEWFSNLFSTISDSTAFQSLKEVIGQVMDTGGELISNFLQSEAWGNFKETLGEIAQAVLDIDFREVITQVSEFLDKWSPLIIGIVGAIGVFKVLSTIIPIVVAAFKGFMILKTLISSVGLLTTGATLLAPVIGAISWPVLAVAAAIGALIAIGVALWKNWDEVKAKATEIWGAIKDFFSETWENIKTSTSETWEGIKNSLSELWEGIVTSVSNFFTPIIEFFTTLWGDVKASFETGWETITNVLTVAWLFIKEMFGLLRDIIMIPWNFIWENFSEPLTKAWESIKTYLSTALDTISNWISEKWNNIKDTTTKVWNQIKDNIINPIKDAWNNLKTKVQEIKTGISSKWEEIKSDARTKWNEVKDRVVTPIKEAWNNLKAKVQEIKTGISTKWNEIKTDAQTKWNEVKTRITTPITEAWNNLKTKVDEIKTGIKTRFNTVKTNVTTTWNNIRDAIMKPIEKARDTVKNAIDKIKGFMDFKWELPKLKMPSFSMKGKFSLNPPSVPSFGISWKAMGGIATGPSIVGIGEAGDEAILPLSNKSKMQPFASAVASMMPEFNGTGGNNSGGDTVITGNTFVVREEADIKKIAQELRRLDDREAKGRGRIRL